MSENRPVKRSFDFWVRVKTHSPEDTSDEEAAEDAAEFMRTVSHSKGKVYTSFCEIKDHGEDRLTTNGKPAKVVAKGKQ